MTLEKLESKFYNITKKIGFPILLFSIIIVTIFFPAFFSYQTIISVKKGETKYSITKPHNNGSYFLDIENILNSKYKTESSLRSFTNTDLNTINIDNKANIFRVDDLETIEINNQKYYVIKEKRKIILTPEINYIKFIDPSTKIKKSSIIDDYFFSKSKIDLTRECRHETCKKYIDEIYENIRLKKTDDKIKVIFLNQYHINHKNISGLNFTQNLSYFEEFDLYINGGKENYFENLEKDYFLDDYTIEIYSNEDEKNLQKLSEAKIMNYITLNEQIDNISNTEDKISISKKSFKPSKYIYANEIEEIKFVHPYNNYMIKVELDDTVEKIELSAFEDSIIFHYKGCEKTKCEIGYNLILD